jgi:hypothetical protein
MPDTRANFRRQKVGATANNWLSLGDRMAFRAFDECGHARLQREGRKSEMAENIPGADAAMGSYATGTKTLQTFASEIQRMSKDSMEQATALMEQLRSARSMEEIVTIQTAFLQKSFSSYAEYTRRFSELMITMPMELARQGQSAFQQNTERMMQNAQRVGDEAQKAGEAIKNETLKNV